VPLGRDTVEGHMPIAYPRIPGHEVAGVVGWFGGCCFRCEPCRRGNFIACENGKVSGISYDGGYAEAMVAPWEALARIPDELSDAEAAPLLCAGITTFNGLRSSVARPGDRVAILGGPAASSPWSARPRTRSRSRRSP